MEGGAKPAGTPFGEWVMSHFERGHCQLLVSAAFRVEAYPSPARKLPCLESQLTHDRLQTSR